MPSRALWALLLVVPLGLSGCIAATDAPAASTGDEPLDIPPMASAATVHDATGQQLHRDTFNGALPVPIERVLGMPAPEPTVGVTSDGTVLVVAGTTVLRSADRGASWEDVTPRLPDGTSNPPTTNDPYLYVDPATDRVFVDHMYALTCSHLAWSDDTGENWQVNPVACGVPFNDHQTLTAGPPVDSEPIGYENIVYYCWNSVAYNACSKSLDGGRTFAPTGEPAQLGVVPGEEGIAGTPVCGGLHGHAVVGPDGSLYVPKGACGTPLVLTSRDEGASWTTVPISNVPTTTHDVDLAIDDAGFLYAVWRGPDHRVWASYSVDNGEVWYPAKPVSPPHVGSTFMPVVAAGALGKVAIGYVGTPDHTGDPATAPDDARWYTHLTLGLSFDMRNPTMATVQAQPEERPVHVGSCIGRCGAFVDFHDIVVGSDGHPYMATASCLDECDRAQEGRVGGGVLVTLADGPDLLSFP